MASSSNNCNNSSGNFSGDAWNAIGAVAGKNNCAGNSSHDNEDVVNHRRLRIRNQSVNILHVRASKKRSMQKESNGNIRVNKLLCDLVKKHPCLYDAGSPDFMKDPAKDVAWADISKVLKLAPKDCKTRWRNVRAAYLRSVNKYKTKFGPNRSKKYYLDENMKFLLDAARHEKVNKKKCVQGNSASHTTDDNNNGCVAIGNVIDNGDLAANNFSEAMYDPSSSESCSENLREHATLANRDVQRVAGNEPTRPPKEIYFMEFIKSIMRDLMVMNRRQEYSFKVKTFNTLNEVLSDPQDFPNKIAVQAPEDVEQRSVPSDATTSDALVGIHQLFNSVPKAEQNKEFLLTIIDALKNMNGKQEFLFKAKVYSDLIDVLRDPQDFPIPVHNPEAIIEQPSLNEPPISNNSMSVCQPLVIKSEVLNPNNL